MIRGENQVNLGKRLSVLLLLFCFLDVLASFSRSYGIFYLSSLSSIMYDFSFIFWPIGLYCVLLSIVVWHLNGHSDVKLKML